MKIEDRIILRTIDGKIIVRPLADAVNNFVEFSNTIIILDKSGIEAWNNGEDITWRHGICVSKTVWKSDLC